jgi:hypothetical protein
VSIRSRLFAVTLRGVARRAALRRLARLTADAFDSELPGGRGLSFATSLERYAQFSSRQAGALLRASAGTAADAAADARAGAAAVEGRLFSGAKALGARLRAGLGIRHYVEAMSVARALYRTIGIDFKGCPAGGFRVERCFFSAHYSAPVCRLISSLDAGLLCGLTGGGALRFTHRMTEGAAFCRGVIE